MLDVDVPSTTRHATRPVLFPERRGRASKKPSCCRPSQASRLFRHSQYSRCSGSGCDSIAPDATDERIERRFGEGVGEQGRCAGRAALSRIARRPVPAAHDAVYAAMESGTALMAAESGPASRPYLTASTLSSRWMSGIRLRVQLFHLGWITFTPFFSP